MRVRIADQEGVEAVAKVGHNQLRLVIDAGSVPRGGGEEAKEEGAICRGIPVDGLKGAGGECPRAAWGVIVACLKKVAVRGGGGRQAGKELWDEGGRRGAGGGAG